MATSEWTYSTAGEIKAALAARKVSAVELAKAAIARIEACDKEVNAVCVRDFSRALEAAKAADQALAKGETRPLLGIPMTVKESFNVAGLPTTWGFLPQKDFIAAEDSVAVARSKSAGAVVLAKTNVPVGLADWQSYNEIYGVTNNPFDLGRSPGGSSGGSSAALAAGYGALSLGSDIGGSLRVPAHFCGIYAHKPTFALAPSRGHAPPGMPPIPISRDLAVIGPMARSAADLELLLDVIAGPDEFDLGIGYRLALPKARHEKIEEFRILVLDSHPLVPTEACIAQALDRLAAGLAKSGAKVARQSNLLPDLDRASRLYLRLLFGILAAFWPQDSYDRFRDLAAGPAGKATSLAAERLRGAVQSHRAWAADDLERAHLRVQWRKLFESFDAVICPVTPTPAFPHDHEPDQEVRRILINGAPHPYLDQILWPGVATAPGLPATAIPLGRSPEGLPIGVQILGPWLEDRTPLRLAALIERQFGGFSPPNI